MDFGLSCRSIQAHVARQLAAAQTREEKALILNSALNDYGISIFKGLDALSQKAGADSSEYMTAQTAASELLTFLALPFISSCSSYKEGVSTFEQLHSVCRDEALRRRLVIYANQIKKRWNIADPSALPVNPRGAKLRHERQGTQYLRNVVLATALIGIFLFILTNIDHVFRLFPLWNRSGQHTTAPPVEDKKKDVAVGQEESAPQPPAGPVPQVTEGSGGYYSYIDKKGITHIGNTRQSDSPHSNLAPVVIKGNQVLVPVQLSYRGRSVKTMLVLDTGASVTTIGERTAALLGVEERDISPGTSIVADGRRVPSCFFAADSVVVGPATLSQHRIAILPGSGGEGSDGLLGMDVLKTLRYHVDFQRSVIELKIQ
jgi:predicted aspartyl protease